MENVDAVKRAHRTELPLEDWDKYNAHSSFYCEQAFNISETIERIDYSLWSPHLFNQYFEIPNRPAIISNAINNWPALSNWNFRSLVEKYGSEMFRCGESDRGKTLRLSLADFLTYTQTQQDDSPLYIFDDAFGDKNNTRSLCDDYRVPDYFSEDLLAFIEEKKRPPFRWFLVGPKRSGSLLHQDPLSTSAWNASIQGYKLWAMFPPSVDFSIIRGRSVILPGEDEEPIFYFRDLLPRITRKWGICPFMAIQRPGEVMFVPSQWWHAVLNLTDTIAVTQNFASSANFDMVYRGMKIQRKKLFEDWKSQLEIHRYDLYQRGLVLDSLDENSDS